MTHYVYSFILHLFITILSETIVIFFVLRKIFKINSSAIPSRRIINAGIIASTLTLPYVWFVFPYLFVNHFTLAIAIGELFAFSVESLLYRTYLKVSLKNALAVSFIANSTSYLLGIFLRWLF